MQTAPNRIDRVRGGLGPPPSIAPACQLVGLSRLTVPAVVHNALAMNRKLGDRGKVTVAFRQDCRSRRVAYHRDLETLFQQLPQVRLDAKVGRHPGQNHLVDTVLAQLQDEIVLLRAVYLAEMQR